MPGLAHLSSEILDLELCLPSVELVVWFTIVGLIHVFKHFRPPWHFTGRMCFFSARANFSSTLSSTFAYAIRNLMCKLALHDEAECSLQVAQLDVHKSEII